MICQLLYRYTVIHTMLIFNGRDPQYILVYNLSIGVSTPVDGFIVHNFSAVHERLPSHNRHTIRN